MTPYSYIEIKVVLSKIEDDEKHEEVKRKFTASTSSEERALKIFDKLVDELVREV
jgi:hypothetical protein